MEPLLRRLRQRADWELLTTVAQSAGLRALETPGWQPETPSMRVRKALISPVGMDEQVLVGVEQLGLMVVNPTPPGCGWNCGWLTCITCRRNR